MNLCDIKTVKQVMGMFHLTFRKEFGQNFLTDRSVVEDIADACCDNENSTILEIGPGMGTLTYELALRHKRVVALEIDRGLIPVLDYTLGEFDNVTVHNEDVMQADLEALLASAFAEGPVSVCANLPYYITSPILMKLLECGLPFDYITVMIQKEVADRLCSPAGGKNYGAITAVLSYYGEAEKLFVVPADKFIPAPKVDSAVIRIRLYKERPYHPKDEALMFRTIKAAFAQRRKTLSNALAAGFSELTKEQINSVITACGFESTIRGERLDISQFVELSDKIAETLNQ
ncbi:MAG: 16S rRNA (adenine(1518)-N(6)/adenine(1519)-N(6))-dimethyltransferase RsmA [Ruminococcaceae bacterium]|nr:16S rRNA (adenine(1518)-N(6)/adenine(1519)-N(6))-dimethyltransferase RsmA [Oscillospiraceae bacterium]